MIRVVRRRPDAGPAGVPALLELVPYIEVVGESSDGEEALQKVPELKPDVLLLDIRMPPLSGIAVLEALREAEALPPTLVLTTFDDGDAAIAAIKAGAKGLMLKDVSLEDLAQAIRALGEGRTAFQPAMTESLMAAIRRGPSDPSDSYVAEALTAREREVLHLICAGYSNKEIADLLALALALAEGTVKNHVSNLLLKLDARAGPAPRSRRCSWGIWARRRSASASRPRGGAPHGASCAMHQGGAVPVSLGRRCRRFSPSHRRPDFPCR